MPKRAPHRVSKETHLKVIVILLLAVVLLLWLVHCAGPKSVREQRLPARSEKAAERAEMSEKGWTGPIGLTDRTSRTNRGTVCMAHNLNCPFTPTVCLLCVIPKHVTRFVTTPRTGKRPGSPTC